MTSHKKNRGAALLMAMLTVTLVATFAAAAMWQQWRGVEVEQAERARVQSGWILTGALDWARLILTEDGKVRTESADYLSEPWAVPLQEAKLSTFLAAERGVATVASGDDSPEAFLSGEIIDLQSKLNVRNLLDGDGRKISPRGRLSFTRLFETLGLPPAQLANLAENLRFAADNSADNRSGPMAPLMPQRVDQLVWLGLAPETVAALQPYVTLLERPTPVNLNTASAEVIFASVDGLSMADAQRLVAERDRSHFRSLVDASKVVSSVDPEVFKTDQVSVQSSYFESRGRLRLGTITVEERSVIKRTGNPTSVKALLRERGVVDSASPGMPLPAR
ncbi:MAG: type II secretion system minor pseudopilin GspK [Ramlibacter sp.]|nr:type II secretion system minor pseudopilin GspK [Ramlibacter sp.]